MQGMCDACGKPSGGNRYCRDCQIRMISGETDQDAPSGPAAKSTLSSASSGLAALVAMLVTLWFMWPKDKPEGKHAERPKNQLEKAMDMRGEIVSAIRGEYCLPFRSSVADVLGQVDDEEITRAAVREARMAGWPRTVVIRRGDQLKVLEVDVTFSSGVIVRVRPVKQQWINDGCWVPADVIVAKEPFVDKE